MKHGILIMVLESDHCDNLVKKPFLSPTTQAILMGCGVRNIGFTAFFETSTYRIPEKGLSSQYKKDLF